MGKKIKLIRNQSNTEIFMSGCSLLLKNLSVDHEGLQNRKFSLPRRNSQLFDCGARFNTELSAVQNDGDFPYFGTVRHQKLFAFCLHFPSGI